MSVGTILDTYAGHRAILRLANTACGWHQHLTGQAVLTIRKGWEINTNAFSTKLLKPLDATIYAARAPKSLLLLKQKCYTDVRDALGSEKKSTVYAVLVAVQHLLKTIGETGAALRCLASFGLVVLVPYKLPLTLIKNGFSAASGVPAIAALVHNIWTRSQETPLTAEEQELKYLETKKDVEMIALYVFSILLNTYGGLDAAFGSALLPEDRLPAVVFNTWATGCSLAALSALRSGNQIKARKTRPEWD